MGLYRPGRDPLGLVEGQDEEFYWRLSNGEIKNGRGKRLVPLSHACPERKKL